MDVSIWTVRRTGRDGTEEAWTISKPVMLRQRLITYCHTIVYYTVTYCLLLVSIAVYCISLRLVTLRSDASLCMYDTHVLQSFSHWMWHRIWFDLNCASATALHSLIVSALLCLLLCSDTHSKFLKLVELAIRLHALSVAALHCSDNNTSNVRRDSPLRDDHLHHHLHAYRVYPLRASRKGYWDHVCICGNDFYR